MNQPEIVIEAGKVARAIDVEIRSLTIRNTATIRSIRRKYSRLLQGASARIMYELAAELCKVEGNRWIAYELIQGHPAAFQILGPKELEDLGQGINSWWTVDAFARTLSGPAWLHGQISDHIIDQWSGSRDPWWRRAALVSTVALNVRSQGGQGDVLRTLHVCRNLADDQDEAVAKALSWALRELVVHNAGAVKEFLQEYDQVLAARVKREVKNKLQTGLKNPKKKKG